MKLIDQILRRLSLWIIHKENIEYEHSEEAQLFKPRCHFQAVGKIKIGKGTLFGPGVIILTTNHDLYDLMKDQPPKPVTIGERCWLGANAIVLPGVVLGNHTIVGAGSIVTHAFPEGNCVIAGNPAKKIRDL